MTRPPRTLRGRKMEEEARALAICLHSGQIDKAGLPYISHLARVAGYFAPDKYDLRAVAWLHDTLEDTTTTLDHLSSFGFPAHITSTVRILTRTPPYDYASYIEAIVQSKDPLALAVKMADLLDHLRPDGGCPKDLLPRYHKALACLVRAVGLSA